MNNDSYSIKGIEAAARGSVENTAGSLHSACLVLQNRHPPHLQSLLGVLVPEAERPV